MSMISFQAQVVRVTHQATGRDLPSAHGREVMPIAPHHACCALCRRPPPQSAHATISFVIALRKRPHERLDGLRLSAHRARGCARKARRPRVNPGTGREPPEILSDWILSAQRFLFGDKTLCVARAMIRRHQEGTPFRVAPCATKREPQRAPRNLSLLYCARQKARV